VEGLLYGFVETLKSQNAPASVSLHRAEAAAIIAHSK
jgi:hypothetical protein